MPTFDEVQTTSGGVMTIPNGSGTPSGRYGYGRVTVSGGDSVQSLSYTGCWGVLTMETKSDSSRVCTLMHHHPSDLSAQEKTDYQQFLKSSIEDPTNTAVYLVGFKGFLITFKKGKEAVEGAGLTWPAKMAVQASYGSMNVCCDASGAVLTYKTSMLKPALSHTVTWN